MKIKAKSTYASLKNTNNFIAYGSTSTHLKLIAGEVVTWDKELPKKLKEHLTEVKKKKGDK